MITISPIYARYVVRDFQRRKLPVAALFEGTALDRPQLETRDTISIEDFNRLLENALNLSGDDSLGLMIGSNTSLMTLGPVGVAAASAPTLRAGLQAIESFRNGQPEAISRRPPTPPAMRQRPSRTGRPGTPRRSRRSGAERDPARTAAA